MGKQLHRYYLQPRLVMRLERIAFLQLNLHGVHVFASDGGAELVGPLQHPKVGGGGLQPAEYGEQVTPKQRLQDFR